MDNFAVLITNWNGVYSVLSQVSATFAGLLFVSLSLRYAQLNSEGFASVKRLARHTFKAFNSVFTDIKIAKDTLSGRVIFIIHLKATIFAKQLYNGCFELTRSALRSTEHCKSTENT